MKTEGYSSREKGITITVQGLFYGFMMDHTGVSRWMEKPSVLLKLGLCSPVPNRNMETKFNVKQKRIALIPLAGKE